MRGRARPASTPPQREGSTLRELPVPTSSAHFPPHHPLLKAKRWAPGTRVLLFLPGISRLLHFCPRRPRTAEQDAGIGPARAQPVLLQRAQGAARTLHRTGQDADPRLKSPRRISRPFLLSPLLWPGSALLSPLLPAQALELSGPSLATLRGTLAGSREPPGEMLMRERGPALRASRLQSPDWLRPGGRVTLCK